MTDKISNVAIVYIELPNSTPEEDIQEIGELVRTANGKVSLTFSQKRNSVDPQTVLGSGKLQELKTSLDLLENPIDVVVFCNKLLAPQRIAIEKVLEVDVIDKMDLILDIFALHAHSAEGKKQVELAQLSYAYATKPEKNFSRQGGGIGTRGPGETKLETNKRLQRDRIHRLRAEIAELEKQRNVTRQQRKDNDAFTVALVGYTNAGKSTLFNALTNNNVFAENLLFATLDTTLRKLKLQNGVEIVLCDTVGFIKDLPHQLVDAFKSTLDETRNADLILNVCDISNPSAESQIAVTENLLAELGVTAPIVRVYNKIDKQIASSPELSSTQCVYVSAKYGTNLQVLLDLISQHVMKKYANITLCCTFEKQHELLKLVSKYCSQSAIDYTDTGVVCKAIVARKYLNLLLPYIVL
ncbi:MAG: GTPase HflX [Clostridia bacterium]|nr:GTPase HflX [Clostridia bacterium]